MAIARFTRGATTINFDAWNATGAIYRLGDDFVPPPVNMSYNISAGTSANRTGGGSLISKRSNNRQFTFSVICSGSGEGATRAAVARLQGFIANETNEPLYFEVPPVAGLPEPLWGQLGAWLRYEVVTGDAALASDYGTMKRGENVTVTVSLEVKPDAVGTKQKVINASGGVFENNYGSADGTAKGLSIFEGTTNKMTNPVFGHATYDNGWTAAAGLTVTKNTDENYLFPGLAASAKIKSTSVNTFYQSINVGNTNKHTFSAYVKKHNGAAVTSADAEIYYNAGIIGAAVYTSIGDGWYRITNTNITGVSSPSVVGLSVSTGKTVYLQGFQLEEIQNYETPLCYGDLLGCTWSSSAHDSTSVRTVSAISATRTDEFIDLAAGAVSIVWKSYFWNTFTTPQILFSTAKTDYSAFGVRAYYEVSDDKFYLSDGTNSISTAAQTFNRDDVLYLTFTWGTGGLNIYKSGVNAATGATFTIPIAANTAIYSIACENGVNILNGDIIGYDVYDQELTAAQCLALYTAQLSIVGNGGRVSTIPWLWTKDGDGIVDNCNDDTRDNWCVVGGIAGTTDALTEFYCIQDGTADQDSITISNCISPVFFSPTNRLTWDESGSSDGNSAGDAYKLTTINVTLTAITDDHILDSGAIKLLSGKEYYVVGRVGDAGDNLQIQIVYPDHSNILTSLPFPGTSRSWFISKMDAIRTQHSASKNINSSAYYTFTVKAIRSVSGSADVTCDWIGLFPKPMMQILQGQEDGILYSSIVDYADGLNSSTLLANEKRAITGDIIELSPNNYNILLCACGRNLYPMLVAVIMNFTYWCTPRYMLL